MSPHGRLSLSLAVSLIIWTPVAHAMFTDQVGVLRGGMLYVGGLVIAYIGVGIISNLLHSYRHTQEVVARAKLEIERIERLAAEEGEGGHPNRRHSDGRK